MNILGMILVLRDMGQLIMNVIKSIDINNQLMRKKITLQVDKLIRKPIQKETSEVQTKAVPEKKSSFDQMYKQAKKLQNRNHLNNTSYHHNHHSAPTSFHTFYESLKGSRNTPKNTNRITKENLHSKLNRSLQAKSNTAEKVSPVKRSTSNERRRLFQRKKQQNMCLPHNKKKLSRNKISHQGEYCEWEGQGQFESEWKALIEGLNHKQHEHLRETECFLNLEEIFNILRSMHYLRKVQDEKYLLSLWQELQGETYGGVPSNNLREFLTYINYCPSTQCFQLEKGLTRKRIVIDGNLKIVISQPAKLQIYQEYLALRVNRILYGNIPPTNQAKQNQFQKQQSNSNNIKIVDEDQNSKKKIVLGVTRKSAERQNRPQLTRQKRSEQITQISEQEQKSLNEDTICHSQFSEGKESGKQLVSYESETSIPSHQLIEEVVIKRPILSVDVNLGEGLCEKLTVFQGETALQVSKRLVEKYNIDESLRARFETMLSGHIRNLLYRIDQVSEEMFSDREE